MIITKETKERFLQMLEANQIIVIQSNQPNRKTYDYKIIGANSNGKWDFTPMAAELSYYDNNRRKTIERLAIRSPHNSADVIDSILESLQKEGLFRTDLSNWEMHQYSSEHIVTFFI